jgi:hypothetical protein
LGWREIDCKINWFVSCGTGNVRIHTQLIACARGVHTTAREGATLTSIGQTYTLNVAAPPRRRRGAPNPPSGPQRETPGSGHNVTLAQRAKQSAKRPHILLDPNLETRPAEAKTRLPNASANEIADQIVASITRGTGPILLCVPGTLGAAFESSMLSTARAFIRQAGGPVSIVSVPYPNSVLDVGKRFLQIGVDQSQNVLALILEKLKAVAPHRKVFLAGESQGSWLISETLRARPDLGTKVERVALFAKPGFVKLPYAIGNAATGARLIEWRHTDDVVQGLFNRFNKQIVSGFVSAIQGLRETGEYEYPPHHYEAHGPSAASWLLAAKRPPSVVHESTVHHYPHPIL